MRKLLVSIFALVILVIPVNVFAYNEYSMGYAPSVIYEFYEAELPVEAPPEEAPPEVQTTYLTTAPLNLRPTPCTSGDRILLIQPGRRVEVTDFRDGVWYQVDYNGHMGFVYANFLRELPTPGQHGTPGSVELVDWSYARNVIPKNTPITIIDVRTRVSARVISFSHGNHADVYPVGSEDTDVLHQMFGFRWSWTTRPIWVIVGDRTFAASINGMPHGGGGNRGNNMNGHLCIHFQGSRTHNGSVNHERDHQRSVQEAFNTAL